MVDKIIFAPGDLETLKDNEKFVPQGHSKELGTVMTQLRHGGKNGHEIVFGQVAEELYNWLFTTLTGKEPIEALSDKPFTITVSEHTDILNKAFHTLSNNDPINKILLDFYTNQSVMVSRETYGVDVFNRIYQVINPDGEVE